MFLRKLCSIQAAFSAGLAVTSGWVYVQDAGPMFIFSEFTPAMSSSKGPHASSLIFFPPFP